MTRYGLLWVTGVIAFGCAPEVAPTNPPETPSGGTAGTGGAGGSAGAPAGASGAGGSLGGSAGSATGAAGGVGGSAGIGGATGGAGMTGGAGSGGVSAGTGGTAGNPGGAGAGGSQAGASTGGAGSGGNAGTAGKGGGAGSGGGGGSASVVPSEGCGKGGRPSSSNVPNTIVSFPATYDGTNPMPLLIGLHGAGRTNDQFRTADARTQNTVIEEHFVVAYVKSAGSGWVLNTDRTRIDGAYDNIAQNYCIDTNRVFATGHSSGAQMIVQLLCGGYDRFAAIAPVASSMYCQSWDPIPTLLVHGANDSERASTSQDADGRKDLAPYVASNGCDTMTMPYTVPACTGGSASVDPGCVNYQGCDAPLIWCQHNDPNYSNTNHGWPCFANVAIDAFLMAQ